MMLGILSIAFSLPLLLAFSATIGGTLKDLDLKSHGRATNATVARIYTGDCGKHSCLEMVSYTYVNDNTRRIYKGYSRLASDRDYNDPDWVYARTYNAVPIAYDPNNPAVSDLNFRNVIFTGDPINIMAKMMSLVAVITLVLISVPTAVFAPSVIRAFRTPAEPEPSWSDKIKFRNS